MDMLEHIRRLTSRMLEAAEAGEWDTLTALEGERRDRLHHFFNRLFMASDAAAITPVLEEMIAIDDRIIALSEKERSQALAGLQEVNRARKADRAYGDAQIDYIKENF